MAQLEEADDLLQWVAEEGAVPCRRHAHRDQLREDVGEIEIEAVLKVDEALLVLAGDVAAVGRGERVVGKASPPRT